MVRLGIVGWRRGTALLCLCVAHGLVMSSHVGCAANSAGRAGHTAANDSTRAIDPSRAFVAYSKIEPPVEPPVTPQALEPLSKRAARQMTKARGLLQQQRFTEAALELERALRYDPNHPDIHETLARLHSETGNMERARFHVERAIKIDPDNAVAQYLLGRCLASMGDDAAALIAYRTAAICSDIDVQGDTSRLVRFHLAQALARERYLEASVEQFATLLADRPSVEATVDREKQADVVWVDGQRVGVALADVLTKLGRFSKAADALAPAVRASSRDGALGVRRARLLVSADRLDEAVAAAQALSVDDETAIALLFDIYKKAGRPDRIIEDIQRRRAVRSDDRKLLLILCDALLELGRPDESLRAMEEFLGRHADAEGVRTKLVAVLIDRERWQDAVATVAGGIALFPDQADSFEAPLIQVVERGDVLDRLLDAGAGEPSAALSYLRGRLCLAAGQTERGREFFDRAVSADGGFVPARIALARAFLEQYRYDRALSVAARKKEDVAEHALLEAVLGAVHERLDDLDRAEQHYKAAVQLDRTLTESSLALANIYRRSSRALQAQRQLKVILDREPGHEEARETLAFLYLSDGEYEAAVEQFEELARTALKPTTIARCRAIRDQFIKQDPEQFRKTLMDAMTESKPDARTWIAIAESYLEFSEAGDARLAYLEALELEPGQTDAALALIQSEKQLLDFEAGAERLAALLPRRPNRHSWRRELIDLYWILQDYDAALALAEGQAARDDITDVHRRRYRLRIAETLKLSDKRDEALRRMESWARDEGEDSAWARQLADEYLRAEQAEKAVAIQERRFLDHGDDPSSLADLLEALGRAGRMDRATQLILDEIYEDPDNDHLVMQLIAILAQGERFDAALELARARLLVTLDREKFQDLTVALLSMADREDDALDFIASLLDTVVELIQDGREPRRRPARSRTDERIARRPNEPINLDNLDDRRTQLRLNLADVLMLAKECRAAETEVSDWLDHTRDPQRRFVYLAKLARVHQLCGRDAAATDALVRALALQPSNVTLNNDVAYGWADRGIRLDEAEKMSRYTVWRSPRQGAYLDTYGWVLYKQSRFTAAKKWLVRASRARGGDDPVVLDHLGDVLWRLGEEEQAAERWHRAAELATEVDEEDVAAVDLKRVRERTPGKVEAAKSGAQPEVAPVGEAAEDEDAG